MCYLNFLKRRYVFKNLPLRDLRFKAVGTVLVRKIYGLHFQLYVYMDEYYICLYVNE